MDQKETHSVNPSCRISILKDGPYLVHGAPPLFQEYIVSDQDGYPRQYQKGKSYASKEPMALCRCGKSKQIPFCDGSHQKEHWKGTETASRENFAEAASVIPGTLNTLYDNESLCSGARFCEADGGVWNLVTDGENEHERQLAVHEATHCPSGRLVITDTESGECIEPRLLPSLSLIEDIAANCSGPLWVRGGITIIGSDGFSYETRNRVTLCRCGSSRNMPFCDGAHLRTRWQDGQM